MTAYWSEDPLTGPLIGLAQNSSIATRTFNPKTFKVAQLLRRRFPPLVLLSLEGLRVLQEGRGSRVHRETATSNSAAACRSIRPGAASRRRMLHGFNLINEGVRQMRGSSTGQVDGADYVSCDGR